MGEALFGIVWSKTTYHTYQHIATELKCYTVRYYVQFAMYELRATYQAQFSTSVIMNSVSIYFSFDACDDCRFALL